MTLELQGMSRSISHRTSIIFFSMTGSILFSSDVAGAVLGVVDGMVFTGLEVSDLIFVSENKCFEFFNMINTLKFSLNTSSNQMRQYTRMDQ